MSITTIFILIIIGLLGGFLSGLMGVGGGIIMIPMLIFFLGFSQQQAQGTSLAVLAVPVTALAAYQYYKEGNIHWEYALIMAVCFVAGGFLGSKLAITLDQKTLQRIFGVVMLIISMKLIFTK
jgi:uncharacterized membrane protein YfcA